MTETWRKQTPIPSVHNQGVRNKESTDRFGPEPKPVKHTPLTEIPDDHCPKCLRPVRPPYTLCYRCYNALRLDPSAQKRIRSQWAFRKT